MAKVGTPGALPQPPATASFLGQGIAYPMAFNASTGRLNLSSGEQSVADAINSMASTSPGERPAQPDYGFDVGTFEPNDIGRLQAQAQQNVTDHEPRVKSIVFVPRQQSDPGELAVDIEYEIVGQATTQVLTYPFFQGP